MFGLIKLFTSFRGRIGRIAFWFGIIVLAMVSPFSVSTLFTSDPLSDLVNNVRNLGLFGLGWSLVLIYVMAALLTKRLHDRNKSGIFAALAYAPATLQTVLFFIGQSHWASWLQTALDWSWLIGLHLAVVGVWFFVELGLYGPKEPNKYNS